MFVVNFYVQRRKELIHTLSRDDSNTTDRQSAWKIVPFVFYVLPLPADRRNVPVAAWVTRHLPLVSLPLITESRQPFYRPPCSANLKWNGETQNLCWVRGAAKNRPQTNEDSRQELDGILVNRPLCKQWLLTLWQGLNATWWFRKQKSADSKNLQPLLRQTTLVALSQSDWSHLSNISFFLFLSLFSCKPRSR